MAVKQAFPPGPPGSVAGNRRRIANPPQAASLPYLPKQAKGLLYSRQGSRLQLRGVGTIRIDAQFPYGLGRFGGVELPIPSETRQRRAGDRFRSVLEELAQMLTIVAASKTVGAQGHQPAGEPRSNLVRNDLHVIGGSD